MNFHPWFCPLYRRIGTTVLCAAWVAFEVSIPAGTFGQFWLFMSIAVLAYAAWHFFLSGVYRERCAERDSNVESSAAEGRDDDG